MTSKARVDTYIDLGFSAERISELFNLPLVYVRERKSTKSGPSIDAAVIMVLGGKSIENAARDTGASLADVKFGVAKARYDIERMARASS